MTPEHAKDFAQTTYRHTGNNLMVSVRLSGISAYAYEAQGIEGIGDPDLTHIARRYGLPVWLIQAQMKIAENLEGDEDAEWLTNFAGAIALQPIEIDWHKLYYLMSILVIDQASMYVFDTEYVRVPLAHARSLFKMALEGKTLSTSTWTSALPALTKHRREMTAGSDWYALTAGRQLVELGPTFMAEGINTNLQNGVQMDFALKSLNIMSHCAELSEDTSAQRELSWPRLGQIVVNAIHGIKQREGGAKDAS